VAVKIKLKRLGKIRQPYYRIVVADSRTKRDGRAIEEIGLYRPKENPSFIQVDAERVAYWLGVGAQPTEAVAALLKVTGDWQAFKGLPAPEPMQVAEAKADKRMAFEAAAKEGDAPATTPKAKKAPKTEAPEAAASDEGEQPAAAQPAPEAAASDEGEQPAAEAEAEQA